MKQLTTLLLAAALAVPLTSMAASAHDSHGSAETHQLQLNAGKKWDTDAPLRQAMTAVHASVTKILPAAHAGKATAADYDAFVKFMEGKEVPYESETRRVLKVLKEAAENDLYSDLAQEITAIEGDLKDDTQTNLHTYRKEIAETINNDIVLRHSYQAGVIEHNLGDDTEVLRATEVLENPTEYQEITTMQTSEKK